MDLVALHWVTGPKQALFINRSAEIVHRSCLACCKYVLDTTKRDMGFSTNSAGMAKAASGHGSMSQYSGPYNAFADLAICGGSSKREGTGRP